jgi:hypothetical protein
MSKCGTVIPNSIEFRDEFLNKLGYLVTSSIYLEKKKKEEKNTGLEICLDCKIDHWPPVFTNKASQKNF